MQAEHLPLGPTTDRAGDVQRRSLRGAPWQHEVRQGWARAVGRIDGGLEARDVGLADGGGWQLRLLARHARELGAEREEVLLHVRQHGVDRGIESAWRAPFR